MSKQKIESAIYKDNKWDITITGSGWLWSMKQAKAIQCPDCASYNVRKNGYNSSKNKPQYNCLNNNCARRSFIIE